MTTKSLRSDEIQTKQTSFQEQAKKLLLVEIPTRITEKYFRYEELFETENQIHERLDYVISLLPRYVLDTINKSEATLNFATRVEGKNEGIKGDMRNAHGCFERTTKRCYIFPRKNRKDRFFVNKKKFLAAGHSLDEFFEVSTPCGREVWDFSVVHELSHAFCNANQFRILNKYEKRVEKIDKHEGKEIGVICRIAEKDIEEDFCEIFEFYAKNRKLVNSALKNNESWIDNRLKVRFEFMKKEVWGKNPRHPIYIRAD